MTGLRFGGGSKSLAKGLVDHIFAAFQAAWVRRGREKSGLNFVATSAIDRNKFKAVANAIVQSNALE